VHVFDLAENKNEAMCEQKGVRKAKLTCAAAARRATRIRTTRIRLPACLALPHAQSLPHRTRLLTRSHPPPPSPTHPPTHRPRRLPVDRRIAFNLDPSNPVVLVGDDHSAVSCLKLSPNLRWTAVSKAAAELKAKEEAEASAASGPRRGAAPKKVETDGEVKKDPTEVEVEKSEKILEMALKNIIDS